ncbi:YceI-like domain-containing protein [Flavobacterium gillisiae]|uniref:YceI-like domain-containing protein n=1 Tax=Flavobacterium gillisiae TaxID=150146 RepID=A0A1H4FH60_9FLAO|nr:YceI family protein [Flavobacterium gillisiae]SEA96160.1 YceI-like domain-containing protein [Flavobacterium gillisiae]
MKKKLLLFLLLTAFIIDAQEKRTSTKGVIVFEASVPFFEPVKAKNDGVNLILNTKKGIITFVVYIDRFSFERSLMQEHFNANYMESKKYPKATFKGLIEKFDLKNIAPDATEYYIKGKITMHGKSKNIRVLAKIKKVAAGIELISNFTLNSDDYNIEIPYIVRSKISKNVNVKVKAVL